MPSPGLPTVAESNLSSSRQTLIGFRSDTLSLLDHIHPAHALSSGIKAVVVEDNNNMLPLTTDDFVFDALSAGDLYRYSRTCKEAHYAVSSYFRRKKNFDLHKVLERYFPPEEVFKFRKLQATTGMIISGSTALQFLDRTEYPESDLDLYVDHRYRRPIAWWLKDIGYNLLPPLNHRNPRLSFQQIVDLVPDYQTFHFSDCNTYPAPRKGYFGAASVLTFEMNYPYRKVQLITCYHTPLELILNFHSTCVMNVITHEKAYSLYPRATFDQRRALSYIPPATELNDTEARKIAQLKYVSRGWQIVDQITDDEFRDPGSVFAPGERHLGDSKCWTLPILPKLELPESNIEANSWSLLYRGNLEPWMIFAVFRSWNLRFIYLISDEDLDQYVFRMKLQGGNADERDNDAYFKRMIEEYRKEDDSRASHNTTPK
ncbi:hypothetical protein GALMADRAFT_145762 [Galerina marginata CBS 339.88]|uniref:F-box domain-containing protein n=1 Tax=Galerina marginata (strain CBS 339.88) TaxID=685588 RepID=A0A067SQI4_GALM3|nr:hypothetical protein GALMADRAFT_145762 [Galerina marginata CBS 339.88]